MTTEYGVKRAVRILMEAGYKPQPDDLTKLTRSWLKVLNGQNTKPPQVPLTDAETIQAAIDWTHGDRSFWPKPGQLKHLHRTRQVITATPEFWTDPYEGAPKNPISVAEIRRAVEGER